MIQHFRQSTTIGGDYPVEHFFRGTGEAVLFTQRLWLSIRAHIIGVRVSDTTAEIKIATAR